MRQFEAGLQLLPVLLQMVCWTPLPPRHARFGLHLYVSLCSLLRKCCLSSPLLCRPTQRCLWILTALASYRLFLAAMDRHTLNLQAGQGS